MCQYSGTNYLLIRTQLTILITSKIFLKHIVKFNVTIIDKLSIINQKLIKKKKKKNMYKILISITSSR